MPNQAWGPGHFCLTLHVAMQLGLYLHEGITLRVRRIVSEDSGHFDRPFLLIVRTERIVTASTRRVASDSRVFQHIAEFIDSNG